MTPTVRSCVRKNAEVNHCSHIIDLLLQSRGRVAQIAADMHHLPTGSHRAAPVRKRRESGVSVLTPMKGFLQLGDCRRHVHRVEDSMVT